MFLPSYNFEHFEPAVWNNLSMSDLQMDEAYLNITSNSSFPTTLYSLTSNCRNCPFKRIQDIGPKWSKIIPVNTAFDTIWRVYSSSINESYKLPNDERSLLCEVSADDFGEFGVYDMIITDENCYASTRKYPVKIYLSLALIFVCILFLWTAGNLLFRLECFNLKNTETVVMNGENVGGGRISSRIKAIDTFRGICLSLMIIVNDQGGGYWFLLHSPWDGITIADVVFPWFLWIMGVCIALSYKSRSKQNIGKWVMIKDVWRRCAILFVLGLTINTVGIGPVALNEIRIMGVLQRFAICYAVVASVMVVCSLKYYKVKLPSLIVDVLTLWPQWIVFSALTVVHHCVTFYLPVPGCPTGYIGVGGIQDNSIYANCTGGASLYVDQLIMGANHLFKGKYLFDPYELKVNFDPENVLGCFTSTFQVFLGVQAGCILISGDKKGRKHKCAYCVVWGILYVIIGLYLHFTSIPMNKNLWSLSFTFVTSGSAFLLLALCYLAVDYRMSWNGAPFIYLGMNSIIVFVGHEICYNLFPWHWRLPIMNTHFISLSESMWGLAVWISMTFWLYKKKFFLSI